MGVGYDFKVLPTPVSAAASFSGFHPTTVKDPVQANILAEEVATLLQKGAITRVSTSVQQAGFYSIYFLVPKKDGGLRPILDLRRLNAHLKNPDIQNAPDKAHPRVNRAGRVVHYDRFKRCVLPCPN